MIPENRRDIGTTNDDLLNAQKASKPIAAAKPVVAAPVAAAPKALAQTTKSAEVKATVKALVSLVQAKAKSESTPAKKEADKKTPPKAKLL